MAPHARLVAAIDALIDKRCEDPLAGIPVVTADEVFALIDLPDTSTRPRSLVDRYGDSGATYNRAMGRLAAAGLRHGYHLGNTRICWSCSGPVDPIDLSCSCYTPARTKENA